MRTGSWPARRSRGFGYLALLLVIGVLATAASASLSLGATVARRQAERQLLVVGLDLRKALRSYAQVPAGAPVPAGARGPRSLDDLLRDPRVPGVRRHLRSIPADPLTGRVEWGLLRDPEGYLVGVYSLAPGRPIQQAGFDAELLGFEGASTYADWVFGLRAGAP